MSMLSASSLLTYSHAGRQAETVLLRLVRGFKARTASDLDGTMTVATQPLTDDEIVSLVHFIATLGEP